METTSDKE